MKRFLMVLAISLLAACGGRISGTYTDYGRLLKVQFSYSGKVVVQVNGQTQDGRYERDGNKLRLTMADGSTLDWTVNDDGSIESLFGRLQECDSSDRSCAL